MASDTVTTNPYVVTAAAAGWKWYDVSKQVILIQWIDDNADIGDNSNLIMTVNGQALEATIQIETDKAAISGAVVWQIGPFAKPVSVSDFKVATMSAGNVHVWFA